MRTHARSRNSFKLRSMDAYYGLIATVRAELIAGGEEAWAQRLLHAERGAATGGEALARMAVVLRDLSTAGVPEGLGMEPAVRAAKERTQELWDQMNRG